MALTNSGFDGTVGEAQFAVMWALGGHDAVAGSGDWAVSQGTGRQVSVAAGTAFAKGVESVSTAAQLAALTTPTNGQWYQIVRHIDWSANTVTIVALPHTTTSTAVPTAPPTGIPAGASTTPGTAYDQLLAWAWVRSTDTGMVLFDLRKQPAETRLSALENAPASVITPASGWSLSGSTSLRKTSDGHVIGALQLVRTTALAANTSELAGNIGAGSRPPGNSFFAVSASGSSTPFPGAVLISSAGDITVFNTTGAHTAFGGVVDYVAAG